MLFSLPFPHAVHGKFPLDAFELSDEREQVLDQWNWDATVARNEWMEENGHPYFEGLTRDNIEWEKITYDEIGLRGLDLMISIVVSVIITVGVFMLARRQGISDSGAKTMAGIFAGSFLLSAFISYNRDTLTIPYYGIGYLLPIVFFATCFYCLTSKNMTDEKRSKFNVALLVMFIAVTVFTETRLSAINIMMPVSYTHLTLPTT